MEWEKLLSVSRTASSAQGSTDPGRNDFERDFDRIVFSTAFRRLQDKTQVIPLANHDFVHTRLTHSLETSSVGRSLGKLAGEYILKAHPELKEKFFPSDFGAIVAAACLSHDIGNPPFGHSGEDAIRHFFETYPGKKYLDHLHNENEKQDFLQFEGNANGFRILTKGSIQLTYATLGAFSKYACEASAAPLSDNVQEKKFGFFQSEKKRFKELASTLELSPLEGRSYQAWCRHPLAFLVEAADDICYQIIDFEDGLRLGLIPPQEGFDRLPEMAGNDFNPERLNQIPSFTEKIAYLRSKVINNLVEEFAWIFSEHEAEIMEGKLTESLKAFSNFQKPLKEIKALTRRKVYQSDHVLEIEAAGFKVLGGLLELYLQAVYDHFYGHKNRQSEKVLSLIPGQFLPKEEENPDWYTTLMMICEYVAGMTDSYALSMYKKLSGIELPSM